MVEIMINTDLDSSEIEDIWHFINRNKTTYLIYESVISFFRILIVLALYWFVFKQITDSFFLPYVILITYVMIEQLSVMIKYRRIRTILNKEP